MKRAGEKGKGIARRKADVAKPRVIFEPSGRRGKVPKGVTILDASRELGVDIESLCGETQTCGKCKVRLEVGRFERHGITSLRDHLTPFTEEERKFISDEEKAEGYRLGCVAQILGDTLIFVPEESRIQSQVVRKKAGERAIALDPAIRLHTVRLSPPTFHDPLGDFDRLAKALCEEHGLPSLEIDHPILLKLPSVLRQGDWNVTVATWMEKEIVDIKPGNAGKALGLAIDVGTTTVAGYLCDLSTGELLATETMMNPQVTYGEDVMSRITYVMNHPEGLERMHRAIIDGLNQLISSITRKCSHSPEDILDMTMVGNTVMHHLFLGINPEYLGKAPFPPAVHRSMDLKARELGLEVLPSAHVHILPLEAGFVGADNVGVIIAEGPHRQDEMVLIVDIGTNGELVLGNRERLISASCATGPVFEGAHIKFGMRAIPGAIERIKIDPQTLDVRFRLIGEDRWQPEVKNAAAKGICGSGIMDGVAEMYRTAVIDRSGRFVNRTGFPRLRITDGSPEFVIAWSHETSIGKDITITQQDVRNVQLGKGALHTGAKLLMRRLGTEKLDKVALAGAFGSYIDPEQALVLGLFPDCDLKHVYAVGNAAGDGARIVLLDREKRAEADEIARKVEYVELTIEKDFQEEFISSLSIPHANDPFPHLEGIVKEEILSP